ncbi:hypothetical protein GGP41_002870 [Bipolaris sorokiniana]|uniref:Uncharacterized protein n=2 Tax=Cochliobolus sativus TaxID=45130 RepID=A0A8H5Z9I8_COCSA|nr:uncharacterized protein COCSADRAFT_116013 [Bipolaris sorokiniana ND90Pr]EMD64870.1 hypothetical protein COCSADRAFT_116013 [Bipolaris sorokiniana ND90Pr]KAF5845271.1 hypothetical protein GGP41_002870 [Bipolaris sorokiniana]
MRTSIVVALSSLSLTVMGCSTVTKVTHTFYGYPDNDPAGPATAYDCGRGFKAGGTGTYTDPLTFASAPGEFNKCEVIYDPYLRKYLRFEDYCAQCTTDWKANPKINHIDVWTGSTTVNGGQNQIQCENDLTPADRSQTIVRQPSANLPVDKTNLYVKGASPACRTSHIYSSYNIRDYC